MECYDMKKICALLLGVLVFAGCSGCGQTASSQAESAAPARQPTKFDQYVSNTVIATGNNKCIDEADGVTYRGYFPLEAYGTFDYSFYFSNTVDSTWDDGRLGYGGQPGGAYSIAGAAVYDGGQIQPDGSALMTGEVLLAEITFDGSKSRQVAPGETFWSDPVSLTLPEDHYLIWEWTITGKEIPCICMSGLTPAFYSTGGQFIYANEVPLPVLIGCDRKVGTKIAAFGDSITQGCQTTANGRKFWAAQIAGTLGEDYALWNLGLGYARASDAARGGDWLERAKAYEMVLVAFGTNDIISGRYGGTGADSPEQIEASVRSIVSALREAGCRVVLFNAPPFDLKPEAEAIRTAYNAAVPKIAEELGAEYFDFAACLADPADPAKALYGGHPNDTGCAKAADAFLNQYRTLIDSTIQKP